MQTLFETMATRLETRVTSAPVLLDDAPLTDHDLGDEVDDGGGGLVRVELCEDVALVVDRARPRLARHEAEQPAKRSASMQQTIVNERCM